MDTPNPQHLHLISCLVEDRPGVLFRISGMFCSRGFNIDSLAVGKTQVKNISRISLVCRGDDRVVGQIISQLNKMVDVIRVAELTWDNPTESELVLVKVSSNAGAESLGKKFHARVLDKGSDGFIIEASGKTEEIEALLKTLEPFGIQEMTRSGRIVLQRGKSVLDPALEKESRDAEEAASPHKAKGEPMSGADMIARVLAQEGVKTIFGYSGGNILPTLDALCRFNLENPKQAFEFIVPANEQGAGFMASGYARSTGKVGVLIVTSGPGATNTTTPIRDAMADSVPLVCISGQVPRAVMGTDAFQEAPILNIMSGCAKHVFLVENPEELEATVRTAFEIARSGRPGPVVIDVPKDVQIWNGTYKGEGRLPLPGYRARAEKLGKSRISAEACRTFFQKLSESEKPLIYAGGGVVNSEASEELKKFAETLGIPVVTTLMGISSFDTDHPLSLHLLGMHGTAYANYTVESCDFLFALGARFDDRVAGKVAEFAPHARFIAHLDADASEVGKIKAVHWSHIADAKQGLKDLLEGAKAAGFKKDFSKWKAHVQQLKKDHPLEYDRKSGMIQPQEVLRELDALVKGEAIITTGVGQHQMWAAQYLRHRHPRRWLTSGSMGTMGFGLPAAIGAQFANPDKMVIDIDGDGSIRMNLGEIETVSTYGLNVKILLLNNEGDGMVRQWQTMYYNKRYFTIDKNLHAMDFVELANAAGYAFARSVRDPKDVKAAVKAFVEAKGPAFLEMMTDHHASVYPIIGPGKTYKEMVTGPFIKAKEGTEANPVPDANTAAEPPG